MLGANPGGPMFLLPALLACIEVGLVKQDDRDDTGAWGSDSPVDSGVDSTVDSETGESAETAADTSLETGDTVTDTADTSGSTDTSTDTAADTSEEPPTAIVIDGACSSGYPYTSWSDSAATEPELNVVGVYESQAGTGGPVMVTVTRSATMVLALTSYSAVDWHIDLAAGHDVTEIIISSYDASTWTFTGAGTATVTYVGWIGECGYEIPDMDPHSGCETPDLETAVEARTGLSMSSFQGCYSGGDYAIEG